VISVARPKVAQERYVGSPPKETPAIDASPAAAKVMPPPWLIPVTISRSGSTKECLRATSSIRSAST
jgi:hypothetical protein